MNRSSAIRNRYARLWPENDRPASVGHLPTPLHAAVLDGNEQAVATLLADGADPNAVAFFGSTPLHLCVKRYAQRKAGYGSVDRDERICTLLLAAGANPRARDFHAQMPAAWGEGFVPKALREAMLGLARAHVWKEDPMPEGKVRRLGCSRDWTRARAAA